MALDRRHKHQSMACWRRTQWGGRRAVVLPRAGPRSTQEPLPRPHPLHHLQREGSLLKKTEGNGKTKSRPGLWGLSLVRNQVWALATTQMPPSRPLFQPQIFWRTRQPVSVLITAQLPARVLRGSNVLILRCIVFMPLVLRVCPWTRPPILAPTSLMERRAGTGVSALQGARNGTGRWARHPAEPSESEVLLPIASTPAARLDQALSWGHARLSLRADDCAHCRVRETEALECELSHHLPAGGSAFALGPWQLSLPSWRGLCGVSKRGALTPQLP